MKTRKQPLVFRIKEVIKNILKKCPLGGLVYEPLHKAWRKRRVAAALRDMDAHGYEVMDRLHKVCEKHGVPYYADCGTLLGFVRDGGFIKGDNDFDLAVMPEYGSLAKWLKILLTEERYRFVYAYDYNGRLIEFTVMDPEVNLTIDFFQHEYAEDDEDIHIVHYLRWYSDHQYPTEKDNTALEYRFTAAKGRKVLKLHGIEVVVPENAVKILDDEYGPWKTPEPSFKSDDIPHVEGKYFAHRLTEDEALAHV